jgi:hypothetical protein
VTTSLSKCHTEAQRHGEIPILNSLCVSVALCESSSHPSEFVGAFCEIVFAITDWSHDHVFPWSVSRLSKCHTEARRNPHPQLSLCLRGSV